MNGSRLRRDENRRLSPLGATIVVLLALVLEVAAWLWISTLSGEVQTASLTRVRVHLPPPLPAPAAPAAAPAPAVVAAPAPEPAAPPEAPPLPAKPAAEETPAAPAPQAAPPTAAEPAPPAAAPAPAASPAGSPPGKPAASAKAPPQLALVPAPAPGLVERGRAGPLPRIAPDGRAPWRVYARPFDKSDSRPRVAIVIGNLGLSGAATEAAIQELPGGVTLAFSPYAHGLEEYISLARAAGHEVLMSLPMEAEDLSTGDAGPHALLTVLTPSENLDRLSWLLSRFTGYVGATNYLGQRFTASDSSMWPILEELKERGLLFLDSHAAGASAVRALADKLGLPAASNERIIDTEASRAAIDQMLEAVEEEARAKGASIAMGFPYPVTIERVAAWTATLPDKGIALAPVSAMVRQRSGS